MERSSGRKGVALVAAIVIAVGAVAGLASVFLPWAAITEVTFEGGTVLGEVVPSFEELGLPGVAGTAGEGFAAVGRSDIAGFLAGILFVAALAAAATAASRSRGFGALLAVASGILALVLALTSLFRSHAIATAALRADIHREATDLVGFNPLLGGLLHRFVDEALGLFTFESSPGPGVYLAIGAPPVPDVGPRRERARARRRSRVQHERPVRPGRRSRRRLSEDPPLRRRSAGWRPQPGVVHLRRGRGGRHRRDRVRPHRDVDLLRRPIPRALSTDGRPGGGPPVRAGGIQARDRPRPLGRAAPGSRDRGSGVRGRGGPVGDLGPAGRGAPEPRQQPGGRSLGTGRGPGPRWCRDDARPARSGGGRAGPRGASGAPAPEAVPLLLVRSGQTPRGPGLSSDPRTADTPSEGLVPKRQTAGNGGAQSSGPYRSDGARAAEPSKDRASSRSPACRDPELVRR